MEDLELHAFDVYFHEIDAVDAVLFAVGIKCDHLRLDVSFFAQHAVAGVAGVLAPEERARLVGDSDVVERDARLELRVEGEVCGEAAKVGGIGFEGVDATGVADSVGEGDGDGSDVAADVETNVSLGDAFVGEGEEFILELAGPHNAFHLVTGVDVDGVLVEVAVENEAHAFGGGFAEVRVLLEVGESLFLGHEFEVKAFDGSVDLRHGRSSVFRGLDDASDLREVEARVADLARLEGFSIGRGCWRVLGEFLVGEAVGAVVFCEEAAGFGSGRVGVDDFGSLSNGGGGEVQAVDDAVVRVGGLDRLLGEGGEDGGSCLGFGAEFCTEGVGIVFEAVVVFASESHGGGEGGNAVEGSFERSAYGSRGEDVGKPGVVADIDTGDDAERFFVEDVAEGEIDAVRG